MDRRCENYETLGQCKLIILLGGGNLKNPPCPGKEISNWFDDIHNPKIDRASSCVIRERRKFKSSKGKQCYRTLTHTGGQGPGLSVLDNYFHSSDDETHLHLKKYDRDLLHAPHHDEEAEIDTK